MLIMRLSYNILTFPKQIWPLTRQYPLSQSYNFITLMTWKGKYENSRHIPAVTVLFYCFCVVTKWARLFPSYINWNSHQVFVNNQTFAQNYEKNKMEKRWKLMKQTMQYIYIHTYIPTTNRERTKKKNYYLQTTENWASIILSCFSLSLHGLFQSNNSY